ncbi:hypothetical protein CK220_28600 [Mesorhizobium sp. WSM3860]|nr:hypothetical protein CK220_28600 [Mesorhizobium sp. WSM3860]
MAYAQFASELWEGHSPLNDFCERLTYTGSPRAVVERCKASLAALTDVVLEEFRRAFASGMLSALVRPRGSAENFVIPEDSWASAFFPERAFLSEEIVHGHAGYWNNLLGRTPFVRRSEFDPWLVHKISRKRDAKAIPSPAVQSLRSHLTELAADGLLSSVDAEAFASKWGLLPLATRPADGDHDPMTQSHWTMCMAATWIMCREVGAVREVMDGYRKNCSIWTSVSHRIRGDGGQIIEIEGEELTTRRNSSLFELGLLEAVGEKPSSYPTTTSVKDAEGLLWDHLGNGHLAASALGRSGEIESISADQWPYLVLATDRFGGDYLCSSYDPLEKCYERVTLRRADLLAIWPSNPTFVSELPPAPERRPTRQRDGKLQATVDALKECYPNGLPKGLAVKQRLDRINAWHVERGNTPVSFSTILRALERISSHQVTSTGVN